ncbi:MAG: MoxR family ATPase [Ilumatobacter sp.]
MNAEETSGGAVKNHVARADERNVQLPPPPHAPSVDPSTSDTSSTAAQLRADTDASIDVRSIGQELVGAIDAVVAGHHDVAEIAVATLFARGHLLIEDIPGVGKTLLAQVIARAVGGSFSRIQGTPDLLPGDVTGSMMPVTDARGGTELRFRPGPIFANVVVFDELNRATPRTQSALLEAAEEATVTVDGDAHRLPGPFMLVATQNPIEIAGTYGLGEGSLDRFAAVVSPGRAAPEFELDVLTGRRGRSMLGAIEAITTTARIESIQHEVDRVRVSDAVGRYVVDLLTATRTHPAARLGASTRAGVSLISLARARAALHDRSYVVADDVASLAATSLGHRVMVADSNGSTTAGRDLVAECVATVPAPTA